MDWNASLHNYECGIFQFLLYTITIELYVVSLSHKPCIFVSSTEYWFIWKDYLRTRIIPKILWYHCFSFQKIKTIIPDFSRLTFLPFLCHHRCDFSFLQWTMDFQIIDNQSLSYTLILDFLRSFASSHFVIVVLIELFE